MCIYIYMECIYIYYHMNLPTMDMGCNQCNHMTRAEVTPTLPTKMLIEVPSGYVKIAIENGHL